VVTRTALAERAGRSYNGAVSDPLSAPLRDPLRARPWLFAVVVWTGPALLAVVDRAMQIRLQGWEQGPADILFASLDWLLYALFTPLVFAFAARWPVVRPVRARRLLLHLGLALLFCVLWAIVGKVLQFALGLLFTPAETRAMLARPDAAATVGRDVASWIFTTFPFGVIVYTGVLGAAHAMRYFAEARDREVQVARLETQVAGARLAALQAQLNPHFLFNSLNTVAVLVRDGDRRAAVGVVEGLSDVLRRTLDRGGSGMVSLGEELELVRRYVDVERARFADRLRPVFDVADDARAAAVPSFVVQHLVENAIRHGVASRTGAGEVRLEARRDGETLEITVTDDGRGIAPDAERPGHGLANTRERLRTLYGEHASLVVAPRAEGGTRAVLRLPFAPFVPGSADGDVDG
jgi:signal transduction histidine kinase